MSDKLNKDNIEKSQTYFKYFLDFVAWQQGMMGVLSF